MKKRLYKIITIGSAVATVATTVSFVVSCGSSSSSVKIGGVLESRSFRSIDQWQKDFASEAWSKTAIENHKVKEEAFLGLTLPSNFYLPDEVTEIGARAFMNAKFTGETTLPYKLEVIDRQAYQGATIPENFAVPRDLRSIGLKAFGDIAIPKGFQLDPFTKSIVLNEHAFSGSYFKDDAQISLTTFIATKIGGIALGKNPNNVQTAIAKDISIKGNGVDITNGIIKDWTFPNKVVNIFDGIFYGADLTAKYANGRPIFTIPKWIETIGNAAFQGAKLPEGFIIPENIRTVGYESFADITIPENFSIVYTSSAPILDSQAFNRSKGVSKTVTRLNKKTYDLLRAAHCTMDDIDIKVQSIYKMVDGHKVIDPTMVSNGKLVDYAFDNFDFTTPEGQAEFDNILAEPSITEIGMKTFRNARIKATAKNQLISPSVRTIGYEAFGGATFLSDFTIPNTLTKIADYAFNGVITSNALTYNSTLSIDTSTFQGMKSELNSGADPINFVFGPEAISGLKEIGKGAFQENIFDHTFIDSLKSLTALVSMRNSTFRSTTFNDKFVMNGAATGLISLDSEVFSGATFKQGADFTGSKIKEFGDRAFESSKWSDNTSIVLPTDLQAISLAMFSSVDLSKIALELPLTINTIRKDAFSDATLNINFDLERLTNLKTIGDGAFQSSGKWLKDGKLSDFSQLPKFKIPSSVTSIGQLAFAYSILPTGFTMSHLQWANLTLGGGIFQASELPVGFELPKGTKTVNGKVEKMIPGGMFNGSLFKGDDLDLSDVTHILANAFGQARFAPTAHFSLEHAVNLHYIGDKAFAMAIVPNVFRIPTTISYSEILNQAFFKTSINQSSTVSSELDANGRPIMIYKDVPVRWVKSDTDNTPQVGPNGNPLPGALAKID